MLRVNASECKHYTLFRESVGSRKNTATVYE